MKKYPFWRGFTPIQILAIGYLSVTLLFALLLMLPVSSAKNTSQPFIDAMFMAASGISTTGLTVVDIGKFYSRFGQIVLMLDFQIGGIGYMAFFILILSMFNIKPSITNQLIATESMAGPSPGYSFRFFKRVIAFTFLFEIIGGIILFLSWIPKESFLRALYLSVFHSISAFCTAGFCLFSDSLMSYKDNTTITLTVTILSLSGAIGFCVLNEIYMIGKKRLKGEMYKPLSIHSKLAIMATVIIVAIGTLIILLSEKWPPVVSMKERLAVSLFQAVSASTTDGFNTVTIGAMAPTCLFIMMISMFIGASPGSTGGGIKTTTAGVIYLSTTATLKSKEESAFFKKTISSNTIKKALAIFSLFITVCIIDVLVLTFTEKPDFFKILFEVVSALANTGLSTGITADLSAVGKVLLSITMFIGRVGPLSIGVALMTERAPARFKYPAAGVFVG